jgi:hypothetical protein
LESTATSIQHPSETATSSEISETTTALAPPVPIEDHHINWRQWISRPGFWPVAMNYMLTRLGNNSSMSLIPFYLTIVLEAGGVTNPEDLTKKTPW